MAMNERLACEICLGYPCVCNVNAHRDPGHTWTGVTDPSLAWKAEASAIEADAIVREMVRLSSMEPGVSKVMEFNALIERARKYVAGGR
jgi:hypothetical protein